MQAPLQFSEAFQEGPWENLECLLGVRTGAHRRPLWVHHSEAGGGALRCR